MEQADASSQHGRIVESVRVPEARVEIVPVVQVALRLVTHAEHQTQTARHPEIVLYESGRFDLGHFQQWFAPGHCVGRWWASVEVLEAGELKPAVEAILGERTVV